MTSQTDADAKRAAIDAAFEKWCGYLWLANWGRHVQAWQRLRAVEDQRRASQTLRYDADEMVCLAVRVVSDTLASQIEAAAGDGQDPNTVRWVLAGLRCRAQPFCTGCPACQTVTAPTRPNVARKESW